MRRLLAALGVTLALATAGVAASGAATQPPVGDGDAAALHLAPVGFFDRPLAVATAPGFRRLLFVVEQPGVVRVLHAGRPLARPFLDIRDLTICGEEGAVCGEQGLLSIAFAPDYPTSRRFYVYYTDPAGNNRVAEFQRSRQRPAQALRRTQRDLLTIPHPVQANHNGGQLAFHGPNRLFIATGDGGDGGDPPNNAQNPGSLLGKILRIDPRPSPSGRPFTVPRDNPFVGRPGRDAIFSLGLRNPFRFSFQIRHRADRLLLADVGQRRYEEINYTSIARARGANFGWDAFEGLAPYACGADCPDGGTPAPGETVRPIFTYGHGSYATPGGPSGCSVTGGVFVRDPRLAPLYRRYVFADFCEGRIRSLIPAPGRARDEQATGLELGGVTSFGEAPDGRVFVTSIDGGVYRIAPG